jgi:pimeloyl-ACP methyl ester carboxylesterase
VVFLHGLLDSSEGWLPLCQGLNSPYLAVDIPGFGHSDPRPEASIADYAADIAQGLKALQVERATLVGHSLGGAIAAAVAELMPANVSALILVAPVGFGRVRLAELAATPRLRSLVPAVLRRVLASRMLVTLGYAVMVTNGHRPEDALVRRVASRRQAEGTWEAVRAIAAAGRLSAALPRRAGYSGPVTALWGDRDRLVSPGHQEGVRRAFPQARIVVRRGMGHHPTPECLRELGTMIRQARALDALPSLVAGDYPVTFGSPAEAA